MNDLITVNYDDNSDRPTIMARDLYEFLGVGTPYHIWFPRMCEYGFTENIDYISFEQNCSKPQGGRPSTNHQLTIDMAKELCMLQRTEKGKQARLYFIELEKQWNNPETVMARALKIANNTIQQKNKELEIKNQLIGELKPKADYTDNILQNPGLVNINQIAKDYGVSARTMNKMLAERKVQYKQGEQWLLYSKYQNKGYTSSETINITRSDGCPDIKMRTKWTQKGRLFIYELLKKDGIMPILEKEFKTA
jgi:anti-repressor protein